MSLLPTSAFADTAAPQHGGGGLGGILHGAFHNPVTHLFGKTVNDLLTVAQQSPAGFVHLGEGLAHDPLGTVEQMGKSTWQDLQHPLRHPGYTLLDVAGLAGGVGAIGSRAAELGRVASGTSRLADLGTGLTPAQQVAHALLHGAPPEPRLLRAPALEPGGEPRVMSTGSKYSRNPTMRAAQKLVDRAHEAFPDSHVPVVWGSQDSRIQSAERSLMMVSENLMRGLPARFAQKYRGVPLAQQAAVRIAAEGVPVEQRIAYHEAQIASGIPEKLVKESRAEINLLKDASKYITEDKHVEGIDHPLPRIADQFGKPKGGLDPAGLQQFYASAGELVRAREDALRSGGLLSNDSWMRRTLGPYNILTGRGLPENIRSLEQEVRMHENLGHGDSQAATVARQRLDKAYGQLSLNDVSDLSKPLHHEGLAKELFRVPYDIRPPRRSLAGRARFRGGNPTPPSTVTHAFEGAILKGGAGRSDISNLIAESYTEALRFIQLKNARESILNRAQDLPDGIDPRYLQAVRTDEFKNESAGNGYAVSQLNNEKMNWQQAEAAGRFYDKLRQRLFPTADQLALEADPKIKWVDKRWLGGLDEQNPLATGFDNPKFRGAFHFIDAVNNGTKAALLYLKPAYAIPNMLGNLALNLVQQGFLAPVNLARSSKLVHYIDGETRETILSAMGGGLTRVLKPQPGALQSVSHASNVAADFYGKFVDDPFRISSFLHEARLEGFKTPEQLRTLTQDAKYQEQLQRISVRANEEIINYEKLTPSEQSILRRVIFFYPWVKGSSRYAKNLVVEHPVTAGITGQAGKEGQNWVSSVLGAVPTYAEGIFPFGHGMVSNPASMSILGTTADIGRQIVNLAANPSNPDLSAVQQVAPFDAALLDLLTAGKAHTGPAYHGSTFGQALNEITGGLPPVTLYKSLTGQHGRLYPDTNPWHALSRFGLGGGLTPRAYNPLVGHLIRYNQEHPRG